MDMLMQCTLSWPRERMAVMGSSLGGFYATHVAETLGCKAVLIKGGHGPGGESIDYLVTRGGTLPLAAPRIATKTTHGTGCSLSSAVAAGLAKGDSIDIAVRGAKTYITAAIAAAVRLNVGHGHGPIHHFHRLD